MDKFAIHKKSIKIYWGYISLTRNKFSFFTLAREFATFSQAPYSLHLVNLKYFIYATIYFRESCEIKSHDQYSYLPLNCGIILPQLYKNNLYQTNEIYF